MFQRVVIAVCLSLFTSTAFALCDRSDFDSTLYSLEIAPLEDIQGVQSAGRMTFLTSFNRYGYLTARNYIWGYDTYEGSAGVGIFGGKANKDKTRLSAQKYKQSCYVSLKMEGVSPVNGYSWRLASSGYASMASVVDEAPDVLYLHNSTITYAGTTEWATVVLTRIQ